MMLSNILASDTPSPEIFRLAERMIVTLCVPLLIFVGYRLFSQGFDRAMNLEGASAVSTKLKITNLTPGTFCFLLGCALAFYVMHSTITVGVGNQSTAANDPSLPNPIVIFSGVGGGTDKQTRPTIQIRRVLSDFAYDLINSPNVDPEIFDKKLATLNSHFSHFPTKDELANMEKVEEKAYENHDQAAMNDLTVWWNSVVPQNK